MSLNIRKKKIKFPGDCHRCDHWGSYANGNTGWCEVKHGTSYAAHTCGKFKPRKEKPVEHDRSMTARELHQFLDERLKGFDCMGCGACCVYPPCSEQERALIIDYCFKNDVKPVDNGETCPFRQDGKCAIYDVRPVPCRLAGYHKKEMRCLNPDNTTASVPKALWEQIRRMYESIVQSGQGYLLHDFLPQKEK